MKINKFKAISVAVCFAVTALWTEIQGMDFVNSVTNVTRNIQKNLNFDSDTALTTTEFLVYESSKDLQREEDKKVISNLNDRLLVMEQERQTFTRILEQIRQESADLRQINANLTDKLEIFSQLNSQLNQKINQLEISQQGCAKAWVVFNGYDATIWDSYGVLSVIKKATARYTVNFSQPFSSENYLVTFGAGGSSSSGHGLGATGYPDNSLRTTHSFELFTYIPESGRHTECALVSACFYGS